MRKIYIFLALCLTACSQMTLPPHSGSELGLQPPPGLSETEKQLFFSLKPDLQKDVTFVLSTGQNFDGRGVKAPLGEHSDQMPQSQPEYTLTPPSMLFHFRASANFPS